MRLGIYRNHKENPMSDFLGPHGKATVILMRAHFDSELPKLKDLKKLLHIPDGRYYKSGGRNYSSTHRLERLLNILSEIRGCVPLSPQHCLLTQISCWQRVLDENQQLILAVVENQVKSRCPNFFTGHISYKNEGCWGGGW
jgi:hypothetical protein